MSSGLLVAYFEDEDGLLRAAREARAAGLKIHDAYTPYAVHGLDKAMGQRGSRLHGLQLWVALPLEHEEVEPSFRHYPRSTLPARDEGGVRLRDDAAGHRLVVLVPADLAGDVERARGRRNFDAVAVGRRRAEFGRIVNFHRESVLVERWGGGTMRQRM